MSDKKLNEGEVYLSLGLDVGLLLKESHKAIAEGRDKVYLAAFKNDKEGDNLPIYQSHGVGVWKRKKGENNKPNEELI
jgi:hypothetical protein